mmetsp:Transcript_15241/g.33366  ORF Transcript_15241/g.33366 Transcript_15241/m.33366 type:complete len:612 (+) Transcript_15241:131-1966(+)|eukprot:CAMPEP_0168779954 /NCGR_PEP_ID=MMETSP0725-20121227/7871_1 /TAXON_ID=265536 /ORGANISM="Amphiprora sp., Strain CCMP467" /LENGTH=611 /DNA_ID=CAMNT_0008829785 /DNA_START=60 /DNA_END=1895 /DNA_ORIENTATION=+
MSAFRDAVFSDLDKPKAMQVGENGCLEYTDAGVGSDILALSQLVRGGKPALASDILERGYTNEVVQLFVLTFVIRNARGGKGEKKLSYDIFLQLMRHYPDTAKALLPMYVHYGYWKDLLLLMEMAAKDKHPNYEVLREGIMELMKHQWHKDVSALAVYERQLWETTNTNDDSLMEAIKKKGPSISLLAKWLPREGKALDKRIKFVDHFSQLIFPSTTTSSFEDVWQSKASQLYRTQLSKMASYLALPEVLLAAQRADEIEISRVASKATKLLSRAFLNETKNGTLRSEDAKRMRLRDIFLDSIVEKGLKGSQVFPHEIVATIMKNPNISPGMTLALDAQWKDLWAGIVKDVKAKGAEEGLHFDPTKMVPLCDVSGSMTGTPMEVAIALGIGISEITHESFRNMVMTFSRQPEWFRLLEGDTIVDKVRKLQRAPWGLNTNFAAAYDLVLEVCEKNQLGREDMPCLIVFSDMQFDQACRGFSRSNMFSHIRKRVKTVGGALGWEDTEPSPIVFWNLRNTHGHPVEKDTEGTVLLSGFSPSLLKLVMNGEAMKEEEVEVVQKDGTVTTEKIRVTPEHILQKMLEDSMYDPVRKILGLSMEGALKEYEPILSGPA